MKKTPVLIAVVFVLAIFAGFAQSTGGTSSAEDALFLGDMVDTAPQAGGAGNAVGNASGTGGSASSGKASSTAASASEGDLFSGSTIVQDSAATSTTAASSTDGFLKTAGMRWGGSVDSELALSGTWNTLGTGDFGIADPSSKALEPTVDATLFFDARPDTDFRVFGKFKTSYPFDAASSTSGTVAGYSSFGATTTTSTVPNIKIFELFSDFTYKDLVNFRFGKHTIKWGVGYFFSPADVLNLGTIDPQNPTNQLEGPISLRTQVPFGSTTNAYLYLILPKPAADGSLNTDPAAVAVAPKFETLIGNAEIGVGGFLQKDRVPRAMTTVTTPVSIFDAFAEGTVARGSDRTYVKRASAATSSAQQSAWSASDGLVTYRDTTSPYYSGTVGLSYSHDFDHATMTAYGQYYYNGEGYSNFRLYDDAIRYTMTAYGYNNTTAGKSNPLDLPTIGSTYYWGHHYAAGALGLSKIWNTDFGANLFAIMNLSDGSAVVNPSISYKFFDHCTASLGAQFMLGPDGSEYTANLDSGSSGPSAVTSARTMKLTLNLSIGSGSF
jgi:hypothetical protein